MKMTPVVVLVSFLLLLLTWLLLSGLNLNSTRFDQQLEALDHFSRLERALNREVLTARAGLSRNYDALARLTDAYDESVHQLREAAGSDAEEGAAIDILALAALGQLSDPDAGPGVERVVGQFLQHQTAQLASGDARLLLQALDGAETGPVGALEFQIRSVRLAW